ncbi:expressed protein [Dictyostelium purpureum]|uniref:Expressed protein n=1 Tax=Dictyostelium purpureum TaxID=5786 RepID=F0ZVR6_DICPU|nr:uncharacterized protein DICPUDRAFT_92691 [Dictyostelium purpureum]EGC31975.1 expressed protein [Dictyostelium purpureum]|eukprot:XP_003291511.1 expressed protein [Dictyostelium purpureum]
MNSLFLTSNDDTTNKIVFRVLDGKAVCYCSHPSVLFCKNCVQMTRNIVNSWDYEPEGYFEKEDLIGQTLFHKSRSHLLEIFKVLRSMENKRLDSILSQIMDLQKKDDFEGFGAAMSHITNFDEVKGKLDDKEELEKVGVPSESTKNIDQDEVFEETSDSADENDEEFEDGNEIDEEEIIVLKPSSNKKPTASKKGGNKSNTTNKNNNDNTPIKINIIDGDNNGDFDIKVNKKTNETNKRNRKN